MSRHAFPGPSRSGGFRTGRSTGSGAGTVWTPEAVRRLGMTADVTTAAQILGIGRTLAFDLLKHNKFPVRVLRIGRRVVVPVPDLLRLLGASPSEPVEDSARTSSL